jgi:MFS transporter, ACS family, DAL5 transporter family protein
VFLQYFSVSKVLAVNVCLWGIVTASTASVQTGGQLLALRTLLGVLESVIQPALTLITAGWYKRKSGVARFGIWSCGLGIGQILGGLISWGFQHTMELKIQGWRLMFLAVGVANVLISPIVWKLPPSPNEASWLSEPEREYILRMLKDDHSGTGRKYFRKWSVYEVLLDLQTWLLSLILASTLMSAGLIIYFSSEIIRILGFSSQEAALFNMPCGFVGIVTMLTVCFVVSKGYPRWVCMAFATGIAAAGACLTAFLPRKHQAGRLIGVYLINTVRSLRS